MITNLTGPDTEMKPGFKARKLRVCGRGESLKHMDHARVARNILNKTRVILEFVMKLRALIADSLDCLLYTSPSPRDIIHLSRMPSSA